jgi:hypothetical protein
MQPKTGRVKSLSIRVCHEVNTGSMHHPDDMKFKLIAAFLRFHVTVVTTPAK